MPGSFETFISNKLSLEKCVSSVILKYKSLKSYVLNEHFADSRFQRLKEKFSSPLLEPVMLFHSSAISLFTHFNLFLQSEDSKTLKSAMENLGKK